MNKISRQILTGALTLILFSSGCGVMTGSSPLRNNGTPAGWSQLSGITATPTGFPYVPLIPITGENVAYVQCQFCVGHETHAVLIFPDFAYFDVGRSTPATTCLTADVVNGRRILICRGPQNTSFNLNICSEPSNCLQFPITLQPCDLLQGDPAPPVYLTPVNRSESGENRDGDPVQPAGTVAPVPTEASAATAMPPSPTNLPAPIQPPAPTQGGGGGGEDGGDIVICHVPPGNPNQRKTMTVGLSAWENEHSKHGDSRGPCP